MRAGRSWQQAWALRQSRVEPPPLLPLAALQGATATLGIYVDCGSVYETPYTTGAHEDGMGQQRAAAGRRGSSSGGATPGSGSGRQKCMFP
jgi:hypothetical protein